MNLKIMDWFYVSREGDEEDYVSSMSPMSSTPLVGFLILLKFTPKLRSQREKNYGEKW